MSLSKEETERLMSESQPLEITPSAQKRPVLPLLTKLILVISILCNLAVLGWTVAKHSYTTKSAWANADGAVGNQQCTLPTDKLLGDIPWVPTVLDNNDAFIHSDPFDGPGWGGKNRTVWDDIYPGAWVAVSDPAEFDYGGGILMQEHAADPVTWPAAAEGFGIAVMHQLHCVAAVKHTILQYEQTGKTTSPHTHLHHCIEQLRQAVMCHGDLTLERPMDVHEYPPVNGGWGNVHLCRDQEAMMDAIWKHSFERSKKGWVKKPKEF